MGVGADAVAGLGEAVGVGADAPHPVAGLGGADIPHAEDVANDDGGFWVLGSSSYLPPPILRVACCPLPLFILDPLFLGRELKLDWFCTSSTARRKGPSCVLAFCSGGCARLLASFALLLPVCLFALFLRASKRSSIRILALSSIAILSPTAFPEPLGSLAPPFPLNTLPVPDWKPRYPKTGEYDDVGDGE